MSDLFHDNISPGQIHEIWDVMKACPQHVFMVLTKRPERMKEVLEHIYRLERFGAAVGFWSHVWLGVTAENQRRLDERVKILLQITAAVRFVSIEPMLGPVDLHNFLPHVSSCRCPECYHRSFKSKPAYTVDWVIAGGETGPGARPIHPDWVWDLRDQCVSMSIPFFFKGWGSWMGTSAIERRLLDGREWNEFPKWEVK
jgi:protein gp37